MRSAPFASNNAQQYRRAQRKRRRLGFWRVGWQAFEKQRIQETLKWLRIWNQVGKAFSRMEIRPIFPWQWWQAFDKQRIQKTIKWLRIWNKVGKVCSMMVIRPSSHGNGRHGSAGRSKSCLHLVICPASCSVCNRPSFAQKLCAASRLQ